MSTMMETVCTHELRELLVNVSSLILEMGCAANMAKIKIVLLRATRIGFIL